MTKTKIPKKSSMNFEKVLGSLCNSSSMNGGGGVQNSKIKKVKVSFVET